MHLFIAFRSSKKLRGPLPGTPEETCPRHFGSGPLKAPVLLLTHQQALKRLWRDLSHLGFNPSWILALLVESIVPEMTTIWLDPISNFHPLFLRASLPPRSEMEGWWSKSPHMKWGNQSDIFQYDFFSCGDFSCTCDNLGFCLSQCHLVFIGWRQRSTDTLKFFTTSCYESNKSNKEHCIITWLLAVLQSNILQASYAIKGGNTIKKYVNEPNRGVGLSGMG